MLDEPRPLSVSVSEHARERFLHRADSLHITPTIEAAWRQAHPISGDGWLDGEAARYDPTNRLVFPVRDGIIRTAIYAPSAKQAIREAVRAAGWRP
ncbi:hypothetical protein HALDL1_07275 [Halobacterium sp. DL1]|jgi:hypothetical protein|nr:hypothetical protein HALDL1_07275 [Halobacterium sp. DL1]